MQILIYTSSSTTIKWVEDQVVKTGNCSFAVDTCSIAEAGMLLKSIQFDAIVLDVSDTEKQSKQVVKALLELRAQIPVVVVTGVLTLPAAVEAVKLGAETYLLNEKAEPGILAEYIKVVITKKAEVARRYALAEPSPDIVYFLNQPAIQ
ncbi:response regulator [Foetidibacter luteolus]|uniref:response regulator n=1 Tax=Foetidibacter luteolus TaxID=2608880 RepID=UPI00129B9A51|nr:response regulator [Foetidibacter luteolus]